MPSKPNFLVIMSDQHNARVMGCAGDAVARTPHLDALARSGARLTSAYCPSPLCVPSRMSFLTSRYPSDQRVWENSGVLDSNIPTFAHALTVAGYETALCGRMHILGYDQKRGFEKRLVGDTGTPLPGTLGMDIGTIPAISTRQERGCVEVAGSGRTAYQTFDATVTQAALDFLRNRADSRPFCLVAGFFLPHCPYICPRELYRYYYDAITLPNLPSNFLSTVHPFIRDWRKHRKLDQELTTEQIRAAKAAYYGLITLMDQHVGELVKGLVDAGLLNNTIVIYTSDHGDMMGDHGLWWKSNFYEGSSAVPMLVSCPDRIAAGYQIPYIANLLDIGPTLLDFAGADPLPRARGRSFRRFLESSNAPLGDWKNETLCENPPERGDVPSRMIRSGPWKLNYYHGCNEPQLFNLEEDPGEWHDRAADSTCRAIRAELLKKVLTDWDGAFIANECSKLLEDVPLIARWGSLVRPDSPACWQPPPDANIFPD